MAIRQIKEVNRSGGAKIFSGNIVGGMALQINADGTVQPWDHTATTGKPYGLAIESNVFFPLQPANGEVAGQGFDYTNFNRGGLESVYLNGGDFVLFDDGRGFPYVTGTYLVNQPVYTSAVTDGLLDSASTSMIVVGYVVGYDQSVNPTQLEIKSIL